MTLFWVIVMMVVGILFLLACGGLFDGSDNERIAAFFCLIVGLLGLGFGSYFLHDWNKGTVGEPYDLIKGKTYVVCAQCTVSGKITDDMNHLVILQDPATKMLYCIAQTTPSPENVQFVQLVKDKTVNGQWQLEWVEPKTRPDQVSLEKIGQPIPVVVTGKKQDGGYTLMRVGARGPEPDLENPPCETREIPVPKGAQPIVITPEKTNGIKPLQIMPEAKKP